MGSRTMRTIRLSTAVALGIVVAIITAVVTVRLALRRFYAGQYGVHRRLLFPAHEQIPSNLIRKTVVRLGADRRHRGLIELQ